MLRLVPLSFTVIQILDSLADEYRTPSLSRACVAHGWNAESRNEMAWSASTINRLARWVTSSGTGLELVRHSLDRDDA